jgi:electron transfer flavoprotein alpha subunit
MPREAEMTSQMYVLIEHLEGKVKDISYVMLAAARELVGGVDGEVVAILLGHDAKDLTQNLNADRVIYCDHPRLAQFTPDAYQAALQALLADNPPRVLIMGETSMGADVAGGLSADMDLPLISLCRGLRAQGDQLTFVSQICGGKILAEGEIPAPTTLITMVPGQYKAEDGQSDSAPPVEDFTPQDLDNLRVQHLEYIQPEVGDVDITREQVLIAVGRGIQQEMNLEYAQDLAEQLDASICGSRPVIDQGWLETSRLVGKSGKHVSPNVYLSMGISGAPEHLEGIGDAKLFIAINTDPQAPIFDVADYGAAADLFELAPALTEKIKQVKGG